MKVRGFTAHATLGFVALCALVAGACGKKGDPLAPLRLVPAAAGDVTGRRMGREVELRFALPNVNANGPGTVDMVRVEIYAITVAAGGFPPANRDLLTKARVVGTIEVRPPAVEGKEPPAGAPPDKRPAPGDHVTFREQLTDDKLEPVKTAAAPTPAPGAATPPVAGATETEPGAAAAAPAAVTTPPGATAAAGGVAVAGGAAPGSPGTPAVAPSAPAAAPGVPPAPGTAAVPPPPAPAALPYLTRVYVIRGIAKSGRPGLPSARVMMPLISASAAPTGVAAQLPSERTIVIDWKPPVADAGAAPMTFNIYRKDAAPPLNPAPVPETRFEVPVTAFGKEECFVVRAVQTLQNIAIESDPSAPACLTPVDRFPPAAPKGLRAVAEEGAVNLVWESNTESDLAGYLILRGEVEGGTLRALTPQPITDSNYRDADVKPGVRYFYAVVAVDTASPRNQSAQSAIEAVTAR